MYSMNDYREALSGRDSKEINSKAWQFCQTKVIGIVSAMVASGDKAMVQEVIDEVYSLNDCGSELEDNAVQVDIWLLESNGYIGAAQELRNLDWA